MNIDREMERMAKEKAHAMKLFQEFLNNPTRDGIAVLSNACHDIVGTQIGVLMAQERTGEYKPPHEGAQDALTEFRYRQDVALCGAMEALTQWRQIGDEGRVAVAI